MNLKGSKLIDFTGKLPGVQTFDRFSDAVTTSIREGGCGNKIAVVVDRGFGFAQSAPHLVSDHINFTGSNPLLGPNDPCGERFPVVNGIYLTAVPGKVLSTLPQGVLGGLKHGVSPNNEETERLRSLGAEFFSYNLAQTMIVAAHCGWKVLGIVVPEGVVDSGLTAELQALVN